ncbi:L-lactate dehydrogenase [Cutibacterium equinum]|uniref:L-lactate dehydrogenase n=1 Tax=Cutibacterium equinum TaxID=3016342 RepID=A0ABY7QY40_9ACTN|nr:L-lactate dehydrogenase [Cutibacterium equinum]WCC79620.1 L-lactate dehydrogenase [Cutibacterium equinum]
MPIKPHKLAIVGVGRVGDAVLSDAMMSGLFGEICVIDVNEDMAAGQALDQHHATALPNVANVNVYAGNYDDVSDADIIIVTAGPSITAGKNGATGAARRELAATNGTIIRATMAQITSRNHDAAIIICSNPLDAVVHIASTEFDHPQGLVLGTGTILDSARMCRVIADHLGVDPDYVRGYMIGEHGPSGFPMFSGVNVGGVGFDGLAELFDVPPLDRDDLTERINHAGIAVFNLKGWTSAGIGHSALTIARSILLDDHAVYPVCTTLRGQYGHDGDVSMGVPCVIGAKGVERILEVPLDGWEREHLDTTIKAIQETIAAAS